MFHPFRVDGRSLRMSFLSVLFEIIKGEIEYVTDLRSIDTVRLLSLLGLQVPPSQAVPPSALHQAPP